MIMITIINQSINQSFICSNNNKNMHINTSESSRTARSHENTDSCPEKECSMTILMMMMMIMTTRWYKTVTN